MIRRLRLAGALVALLALSAYVVESVQAAVCLPVADTAAAHGDMHHETAPQDAPQDGAPDTPQCPLGMAGMGGSCVAVTLPATVAVAAAGFETPVCVVASTSTVTDLLFATPHFRPPRA